VNGSEEDHTEDDIEDGESVDEEAPAEGTPTGYDVEL
jgi:hypothetical protein